MMESQGGLPELGRWGIKSSNLNSDIVFYKKNLCLPSSVSNAKYRQVETKLKILRDCKHVSSSLNNIFKTLVNMMCGVKRDKASGQLFSMELCPDIVCSIDFTDFSSVKCADLVEISHIFFSISVPSVE